MHLRKTYKAGNIVDVQNTYTRRYGNHKPHAAKINKTPEAMRKYNAKMAERELNRIIHANFSQWNDWFVTLTYNPKKRLPPEEAKKALAKFMRKARKYYREHEKVFKYIAVTEYENTALHHHMVINDVEMGGLCKLWEYGTAYVKPLYTESFEGLAHYLIKETSKTFSLPGSVNRKRYNVSKNLVRPKPVVEVMRSKEWRKEPRAWKGYMIDKASIEEGVSPVTGRPYQFYRMIRVEEKQTRKKARKRE